ncbi:NAD(P)H-dependent oxidoreductase [Nonomuraea sp. NPDC048901]|uniref:NADPH-dependent FMN reductase n=1 Tax=unclassified Nonomuraea TaxID=2593643 RepID=UPI0033D22458
MRIFGIAASLQAGSFITRLLEAMEGELPRGARLECWRGLGTVPPHSLGPVPEQVAGLLRKLDESDAVLITAPEHSLLPAELGHALRWMSTGGRLAGKHVAVMSASVRACGAMWAQAELFKELTGAGAVVMGTELVLSPTCPHFDDQGRLTALYLRDQVRELVGQLCPVPHRTRPVFTPRLVLAGPSA